MEGDLTSQSSVIPGGDFNKYLHFRRLRLYARPPCRAQLSAPLRNSLFSLWLMPLDLLPLSSQPSNTTS